MSFLLCFRQNVVATIDGVLFLSAPTIIISIMFLLFILPLSLPALSVYLSLSTAIKVLVQKHLTEQNCSILPPPKVFTGRGVNKEKSHVSKHIQRPVKSFLESKVVHASQCVYVNNLTTRTKMIVCFKRLQKYCENSKYKEIYHKYRTIFIFRCLFIKKQSVYTTPKALTME